MTNFLSFRINRATKNDIKRHLIACDKNYKQKLSHRVDIETYANKIFSNATRFEAWSRGYLIGLLAVYCNRIDEKKGFITNVSVLKEALGKGIATILVRRCIDYLVEKKFNKIELEVHLENIPAIELYKKSGFKIKNKRNSSYIMTMDLMERLPNG
jgi:ribosomal protein S18 acetylase RimI-like enzyme